MNRTEQNWIDAARTQLMHGDFAATERMLAEALIEYAGSFELRRILAAVLWQLGNASRAESILLDLHAERPQDFPTAFTLAQILVAQSRNHAAGEILRDCFNQAPHNPELAIQAIELLDDSGRKYAAAGIADRALADAPLDPRLHAYAGMLKLQLGDFSSARQHYLFAIERAPEACGWHAPHGLASAQRYTDRAHPDFALFESLLHRSNLDAKGRASLLFALGKAQDDIGDYQSAAGYFRRANTLARALTNWSRKQWRRAVEARLSAPPINISARATHDFVPIFIVGMPRSGTTLLAELLSRTSGVLNRGELPGIAILAQTLSLAEPRSTEFEAAAANYRAQSMQDDADGARWFIDKQPLNFRYIDFMLALFPNARIISCRRSERDTALSIWMQSFAEDVQGFANDFSDILTVMRDRQRLDEHWCRRWGTAMRSVSYEALVADPQGEIAGLRAWMGLPDAVAIPPALTVATRPNSISTASLWQARQPVFTRSVQRWRSYVAELPELLRFAE